MPPTPLLPASDTPDELIPTRWTLVERLKDWEDQVTWKEFFDIYWRLIHHTAVRGGCTPTEAEEVVQETVISVARRIQGFEASPELGSFKGWLLQVTRCRIVDQLRRRNHRLINLGNPDAASDSNAQVSVEHVLPTQDPETARNWDADWEKTLLTAAIQAVKGRVNPRHFQIFDLHVLKDQPLREVARALGVTSAQVYLVKHRVSLLVRQELRRLGKRYQ